MVGLSAVARGAAEKLKCTAWTPRHHVKIKAAGVCPRWKALPGLRVAQIGLVGVGGGDREAWGLEAPLWSQHRLS